MNASVLKECLNELEALRIRHQRELHRRIDEASEQIPELSHLRQQRIDFLSQAAQSKLSEAPGSAVTRQEIDDALSDFEKAEQILLVRAGYPADYLKMAYRCEQCRDTGYVGESIKERCTCLTQAMMQREQSSHGGRLFADQTFDRFDILRFPSRPLPGKELTQREYMDALRKRLEAYSTHFPDNANRLLLLSGATGLGKTFILQCMANRILSRGYTIAYYSAYTLLDFFFSLQFNDYDGYTQLRNTLASVDLLVIDDLGSETMRSKYTVEDLFFIINLRIQEKKHLFVSTNLKPHQLSERYTERISSRLLDTGNAQCYLLEGDDLRLLKN